VLKNNPGTIRVKMRIAENKYSGKIIIIGASAAGISAAKEIRTVNNIAKISIITEENHMPYYRPYLTEYIKDNSVESRDNFGLNKEKWYKNNNINFPAYITVTSIKTIFMMSEDDLKVQTLDTIKEASNRGIVIDEASMYTGIRTLNNGHKTTYVIYDGNDTSKEPNEIIKIIGESWNCGTSGTSIICIGLAQLTDNAHNKSELNITYWAKIIKDNEGTFGLEEYKGEDGLIFNVKCH